MIKTSPVHNRTAIGNSFAYGLGDLASIVDTAISISNNRLMKLALKGRSFLEAFKMADDVLRQTVQGISEIMLVDAGCDSFD